MFEDFYMPQFDADYFSSPAFQQAIAAAVDQYSPAPVEPVYYAPPPVPVSDPYVYQNTAGIGNIPQYMVEDYALVGGPGNQFTAPQILDEQLVAERIAAEQAIAAKAEAERLALVRAQELEAAAARTQSEAIAARAEQARMEAERATAERVAAEQVAVEQARVQADAAAAAVVPEQIYTPAPVVAPEPVYTPAVQSVEPLPVEAAPVAGIGAPVAAEPVDRPAMQSVEPVSVDANLISGIGSPVAAESVYAPAVQSVEPVPVEATPVAGIGSPVVAEPAYTPAVQSVEPDMYTVPNTVSDGTEMMFGEDLAYTGPRPTKMPTPDVAIPYRKPSATPGLDFVTNDGQQGYYFVTNAGKPAKTKANPTAFVAADPNAQYRLVNERGQNVVVTSGTGEQGLRDAYAAAQKLSTEGGKKADWFLERSTPDGKWTRIADDDPKGSDLGVAGKILGAALPIATAFIPGLGVIGTIAMQAASGAAGSALAGGDPLKGAVIGGLTAGGGQFLSKPIGAALNVPIKAGTAIGTGIGATAGNLITGQNLKNSLLSGLASGAGSYLAPDVMEKLGIKTPGAPGGSTYTTEGGYAITGAKPPSIAISGGSGSAPRGDAGADNLEARDIVVSATPPISPYVAVPGIGSAGTLGLAGAELPPEALPEERDIIVSATPPVSTPIILPSAGDLPPVDYEQGIDVKASRPTVREPDLPNMPVPLMAFPTVQTLPVGPQPDLLADVNPEAPDERSLLDKALDVADIATTVLPVVGGVVGGGGGSGVTLAPDTSKLTFRPSTLRPTLTGGGIGGAGGIGGIGGGYPYTPQTYGRVGGDQETEYLFFTRDPAAGTPVAAPVVPASAPGRKEGGEINDDMVKHLLEYRKGGGHHGPGQVKGIGSGQEDKIPAWLSDGEYVWSAQDVADLGDGSTDEGVRRLDKMRQMVRQQAGRKDVKKIAKPQKGIDRMLKAVGGLA